MAESGLEFPFLNTTSTRRIHKDHIIYSNDTLHIFFYFNFPNCFSSGKRFFPHEIHERLFLKHKAWNRLKEGNYIEMGR